MIGDIPLLASDTCNHELAIHGRYGVIACAACGLVEWFGPQGVVDPAEAVAALFGSFDLIGSVPSVGAPSRSVLAYKPGAARRRALGILPRHCWLGAGPQLWLATDGEVLLLATPDELMVHNLTRGA
ncbi:MAG: hypothetical protein WB239_07390 [Acidimicrobiia bacterium]